MWAEQTEKVVDWQGAKQDAEHLGDAAAAAVATAANYKLELRHCSGLLKRYDVKHQLRIK